MVAHPPRRIKVGRGQGRVAGRTSPRQPEHQQKCAVQLLGRFGVDAANNPPNAVATECNQFVDHDLRPKAKPVLWGNLDYRPERKSVLQVR